MLELILAFGVGAAASSWLHLKGRRAKSSQAAAKASNPVPSVSAKSLGGAARSAVIFMTLPPELSAKLFNEMGPEEVQRITLEITQLPAISPETRSQVCSDFSTSLGIGEGRLEEAAKQEPALIAKALSTLAELAPR